MELRNLLAIPGWHRLLVLDRLAGLGRVMAPLRGLLLGVLRRGVLLGRMCVLAYGEEGLLGFSGERGLVAVSFARRQLGVAERAAVDDVYEERNTISKAPDAETKTAGESNAAGLLVNTFCPSEKKKRKITTFQGRETNCVARGYFFLVFVKPFCLQNGQCT